MSTTTAQLHPDLRGDMQRFVESVQESDNAPPLSEYKTMRLEAPINVRERVAFNHDGAIVGYGQAAWHRGATTEAGHWAIEVVVAASSRHGDVAGALIDTLQTETGGESATLWARSEYVAAAAVKAGWVAQRELLEMRCALPVAGLQSNFTAIEVATFRMGVDEKAWVEANNAAFAGHPENGHMTRRDLENRMARSWFDPRGFFLAWDKDELAGSCWTKIHEDGVGEIYIIGVVPAWEGRGLGRDLVSHGLRYLGETRHLTKSMLFVESANRRAMHLYEALGFEVARTVVAYGCPPSV